MKKLFVAAALVMGLGTSATFADNFMVDSVTVTMINDFTPIEVKDLPAAVQEAITKNYAEDVYKRQILCTGQRHSGCNGTYYF